MANTPNYGLYKPDRADNLVEVDTSLANNFTIIDTELKNLAQGSGTLTFSTFADLQAAYPSGTDKPVWVTAENSWYYWTSGVDTTAPTVTASPVAGTYSSTQNVTLSTNEAATIYYTTNGTTPTTSSSVYSSPISVSATTLLKYFARDTAGNSSAVQSATYTISAGGDTTPPTITASPVAGTFSSTQSVTLTSDEVSTIYYTTDGSTPTISSSVYSTPLSISATTTLKYFGKDTAGNSSGVQTQVYTINGAGSVIVSDNFNKADGVLTSTTTGQTWLDLTGFKANIISNQVGYLANSTAYANVDSGFSDNIDIEMDLVLPTLVTGNVAGIAARVVSGGNQAVTWGARTNGTKLGFLNTVTGSSATPADVSFTFVAGQTYRLKMEIRGNVYKTYIDNVLQQTYTDTNSVGLTSTKHGFIMYNSTVPRGDNFTIKLA